MYTDGIDDQVLSAEEIKGQFEMKFPTGMEFTTMTDLSDQVKQLTKKTSFVASKSGECGVKCNISHSNKEPDGSHQDENIDLPQQQTPLKGLRIRCEFLVSTAFCLPTFSNPNNELITLQYGKDRETPEQKRVVILSLSNYLHTKGCRRSYQQFVYQAKAAGNLLEKESSTTEIIAK